MKMFLLGLMAAYTPSLLLAAILLWRLPSSAAMELQDELDGKLGA
jgi:hypothetical protein